MLTGYWTFGGKFKFALPPTQRCVWGLIKRTIKRRKDTRPSYGSGALIQTAEGPRGSRWRRTDIRNVGHTTTLWGHCCNPASLLTLNVALLKYCIWSRRAFRQFINGKDHVSLDFRDKHSLNRYQKSVYSYALLRFPFVC